MTYNGIIEVGVDVMRKVVGADPLLVSPVNPNDYKCVNGEWKLIPGWYKNIKSDKEKMLEEFRQKYKKK